MNIYPPQIVHVRTELERMTEYVPGESAEAFSTRTGIPIDKLIKLNSNENPYSPACAVLSALSDHTLYNYYPDTTATALRAALSAYTGLDDRFIVLRHATIELIRPLWHIFLAAGDNLIWCPPPYSFYTAVATLCRSNLLAVP